MTNILKYLADFSKQTQTCKVNLWNELAMT